MGCIAMRGFAGAGWAAAGLAAALLAMMPDPAPAQVPASQSPAEICLAANLRINLGASLPRTAARLRAGELLRIVAVGSSSTTGLWVLRRGATYPEVMGRELAVLRPGARVEMINSGRVGDTVGATMARFARDVIAYQPDLVVWQLGTNDVAWGGSADGLKDQIVNGVRTLKTGADVILMDLQYAPAVLASSQYPLMQSAISEAARQERVGLFSRFALMRRSIDAGLSPSALVSWDGLHNSAAGYDCIGRALARAVDAGAR
jgi:acyl-CoA thioesterase I